MSINMANVKSITLGGVSVKKIENLNGDVLWEGTSALSSISISGYTTSFTQNDPFVFGGTVTAHYTNGSTKDVTSSAIFSGYNMSSISRQRVTVSYTENEITKTTSYYITVTAAPLYLALGGNLYLLDKSTKTFSTGTVTDPSSYFTSSQYIWRGGDTMFFSFGKLTDSREQKKITISGSELVTTGNAGFFHGSSITSFDRAQVFYNGTDYYVHQGTGAGTTKDYRINLETGAFNCFKIYGNAPIWSSCPCVRKIPFTLSIFFIKYETSGITTSIPNISSSGNFKPQSITTISFLYSIAVIFFPISFIPPRGIILIFALSFFIFPLLFLYFIYKQRSFYCKSPFIHPVV